MYRSKSSIDRPPTRSSFYKVTPAKSESDLKVQNLINSFNPKALANSPPQGANADFLNTLYQIILCIQNTHKTTEPGNLNDIVHLQAMVINHIYNHIGFHIKQGWIPK
jgi:hypothetical protein